MTVQFRVEVGGIEDFAERMRRLDDATQKYVQDALNQTGRLVIRRAQELAPIRTGRLISSIYSQIIYKWVVKVACMVPYAIFQELGTRYIQARYFLTRALSENAMNFLSIVAAALQYATEEASSE
jgi:HK97 gp10 family phage protein